MINSVLQWEKQAVREVTQVVQTHTHIHQTATGSQTLRRGFPKMETSLTVENPPNKSSAPQIFGNLLYAGHHPPLHDLEINQRTNKEARPRNTCNLGGVVSWGQGRGHGLMYTQYV